MPTDLGGELVLVGSADATPHKSISRRDFLKLGGVGALLIALSSCRKYWPAGADVQDLKNPVSDEALQKLLEQSQKVEQFIPAWAKAGLTKITIDPLTDWGGPESIAIGSGYIGREDYEWLDLLTLEHVGSIHRWKTLTMEFPNCDDKVNYMQIDARINAENGDPIDPDRWYIEGVTEHSDLKNGIYRPLRGIRIHKAPGVQGNSNFVTRAWGVQIHSEPLNKDDVLIGAGFPAALNRQEIFRPLKFIEMADVSHDPDAGIPMAHFEGVAGPGDSGGPVWLLSGKLYGFIRGGAGEGIVSVVPAAPYINEAIKLMRANNLLNIAKILPPQVRV